MAFPDQNIPIILASASAARRAMLASAGVVFTVQPADLDEAAFRDQLVAGRALDHGLAAEVARALAAAKARAVSSAVPDALVIGSDQVLSLYASGTVQLLEKPGTPERLADHLTRLRGQSHQLASGVALARGGAVVWDHVATADITLRGFSDAARDAYIRAVGHEACRSVGGYQIEGLGAQLIAQVEGDHFTVLGMPLFPLLEALRREGVLPA